MFFSYLVNEKLALAWNTYAGEKYLYCCYGCYLLDLIGYLIILELELMYPLG